jgi:hypothetical protein
MAGFFHGRTEIDAHTHNLQALQGLKKPTLMTNRPNAGGIPQGFALISGANMCRRAKAKTWANGQCGM